MQVDRGKTIKTHTHLLGFNDTLNPHGLQCTTYVWTLELFKTQDNARGFETLLAAAVTTVMNGQNELTITMCGVKSVVEDREASVWESLFLKINYSRCNLFIFLIIILKKKYSQF